MLDINLSPDEFKEFFRFIEDNYHEIIEGYPELKRLNATAENLVLQFLFKTYDGHTGVSSYSFRAKQFHSNYPQIVQDKINQILRSR